MRPWQHCVLGLLLGLVALVTYTSHHTLPRPKVDLHDAAGRPQFSEANALRYVSVLADEYGYRIVGAKEHVESRNWLKGQIAELQAAVRADAELDALYEIEVLNQLGSGSHRFDFMGKPVMKQYADIENVVVRISSRRNARCKDNAVLVNAHLDSTLPSPGAADDALGIAIELELLRIITARRPTSSDDHVLENSVILLFNDAEESLQDASHLFANEPHPWAHTVRGVVNLEAAGNKGASTMFQATSNKFLEAYGSTPRPHGSVLASDVFATGLILSDTDFRQFEEYGNMTGLDMAVVGNSYAYHTRLDTTENIEPGAAQHFGENTLAIVDYLTKPGMVLDNVHKSRDRVYFSVLQTWFVNYPRVWGQLAARLLFSLVLCYVGYASPDWRQFFSAWACIGLSFVAGIVGNNIAALCITFSGLQMKWFTHEFSCLFLYIPFAAIGWTAPHLYIRPDRRHMHLALMTHYAVLSLLPLGSAFLSFFTAVALLASTLAPTQLMLFFIASAPGMLLGSEAHWSTLTIFVPLTGRMGVDAPAEHIVATLVGLVGFVTLPTFPLWINCWTRKGQIGIMSVLLTIALTSLAYLGNGSVWDAAHPRRLFVQHMYNMTDHSTTVQIAAADSAPGFEAYVHDLAARFDLGTMRRWHASDDAPEWEVLYPFSQFLQSYEATLPTPKISPAIEMPKVLGRPFERNDLDDTVSLDLVTWHPGLLWTVIAFDAEVISWSLSDTPPDAGQRRHHVRQASAYGTSAHDLRMQIRRPASGKLYVDFVGVEELAMHPAKVTSPEALERPSMQFFAKIDAPGGVGDAVDLCSNGVIAARFEIDV